MEGYPIGAPGFEPGTSPTRTVRATRLRHAPKAAIISETTGLPPMTRRLPLILAVLSLLALAPAADAGVAPPSFAGISPQKPDTATDFALMRSSGVKSVRLPMYWT